LGFYPQPGLMFESYKLSDINSDGFTDYIISGLYEETHIVINTGEFEFELLNHNLDFLVGSNYYFGDYNNDGYLDIF